MTISKKEALKLAEHILKTDTGEIKCSAFGDCSSANLGISDKAKEQFKQQNAEIDKSLAENKIKNKAELTDEVKIKLMAREVVKLKTQLSKKTLEINAVEKNANEYIEFLKMKNNDFKTTFDVFKKSMELSIKESETYTFEDYSTRCFLKN